MAVVVETFHGFKRDGCRSVTKAVRVGTRLPQQMIDKIRIIRHREYLEVCLPSDCISTQRFSPVDESFRVMDCRPYSCFLHKSLLKASKALMNAKGDKRDLAQVITNHTCSFFASNTLVLFSSASLLRCTISLYTVFMQRQRLSVLIRLMTGPRNCTYWQPIC